MILVGLGGNLPSPVFGPPPGPLEAALRLLEGAGLEVRRRSRWYRSAPVPSSSQPWFVNAVAVVETGLAPHALLDLLLAVEARLGRVRERPWEPRVADLDLLAYGARRIADGSLTLPHPRLHERAFVLRPLAEVAPGWRHPVLGRPVEDLLADLPPGQTVEPL